MNRCFFYLILLLILSPAAPAWAQSPYRLQWGKELLLVGAGGVGIGAGAILKDNTPLFTVEELERLDPVQVNAFDRVAIDFSSSSAREASDYFLDGSHVLPLLLMAGRQTRRHFGQITLLWGETLLINGGLTLAAKYSFRRPRPFVFNAEMSVQEKQTVNAKTAFFSGHTSMTAANAFFAAKVYADFYPDSKWRPAVWAAAATIPAITGYLRVRAGRHYPTDVIAGYAVGALTGYFVPHLHKNLKLKEKGIELYGGWNGGALRVVF